MTDGIYICLSSPVGTMGLFLMRSLWQKGAHIYMKEFKSKSFPKLLKLHRRSVVWVHCRSADVCRQFYSDAERAGFSFGDGIPLSQKPIGDLIAIHSDRTLAYLGFAGHMALQARARYTISGGKRTRLFIVEYGNE